MFVISFDGRDESERDVAARHKQLSKLRKTEPRKPYHSVEIHTYSKEEWVKLVEALASIGISTPNKKV